MRGGVEVDALDILRGEPKEARFFVVDPEDGVGCAHAAHGNSIGAARERQCALGTGWTRISVSGTWRDGSRGGPAPSHWPT